MKNVSKQLIKENMKLIKKGIARMAGESELEEKMQAAAQSGKPLVIKLGLDPTAPDLHLGHTVVLRKIRQFQSMGHKAFLIIGDFTGRIGDPTGKEKTRPQLTEDQVLINADTYKKQLFKVLDEDQTVVCFNSEWLGDMRLDELMRHLSNHTVARMLERDSFRKRMDKEQPIGLHEFLYPLIQGIDSLEVEADVEIGGLDQTFNILMGREVQGREGVSKQAAIFMPILEGIDSDEKMSKSLGNAIGIDEPAPVMFEKLMQIGDGQIIPYFELLTDLTPDRIEDFRQQLTGGRTNPKNIKLRLAREITKLYHGDEKALMAEERFVTVHQKRSVPRDVPFMNWETEDTLMSFLTRNKVVPSRSEVRRLVTQKGIRINDVILLEPEVTGLKSGDVIRIGKKRFVGIR